MDPNIRMAEFGPGRRIGVLLLRGVLIEVLRLCGFLGQRDCMLDFDGLCIFLNLLNGLSGQTNGVYGGLPS